MNLLVKLGEFRSGKVNYINLDQPIVSQDKDGFGSRLFSLMLNSTSHREKIKDQLFKVIHNDIEFNVEREINPLPVTDLGGVVTKEGSLHMRMYITKNGNRCYLEDLPEYNKGIDLFLYA